MERNLMNGRISPSNSTDRSKTVRSLSMSRQPNYSSRTVREALEHLASIDLIELCNEAKVERCRATRDLRSCGRDVQSALISCGHASLCSECSQRCDLCPICRIPLPKSSNRLRLRLYDECVDAGLISRKCDEGLQEKEDGGDNQLTADVQRLYSLFDVSLENNLVSLICHYVTDVCMDESAVSSDPVVAFLLDEVVVKDWCKRTFRIIVLELQEIYNLKMEEMRSRLNSLLRFSIHLTALSAVVEVLESSFKGNHSAQLHDLQILQESILKTKQHMEIMKWCISHQFLENVESRYDNISSWRSVIRERKSAAIMRAWPDVINQHVESNMQIGSLFIEDALSNLEIEQGYAENMGEESVLASLQKGHGSFFRSNIVGVAGRYPFESLRTAIDVLFLHGSSDTVVAKQAILLYYFFDRHWKMPDENMKEIVEDFAATFGISRHALLESLAFYLLDDHPDEALKEACSLLPEIVSTSTHPKIAQVLLEREAPEAALMVLRWSGRDGSQLVLLTEAVTAVRVRFMCGLLTEAFMHQRLLCSKVKEKKRKGGFPEDPSTELHSIHGTWEDWVETLVTEICCLCIKNKLVDRMIELPWNSDEEKYIHKCLLDCAIDDPSSTTGSLLVVFYLQRYRYAEAYQLDVKLQTVEQEHISKKSVSDEVLSRMKSASSWRTGLVAKSIELLPQVQQEQVKAGKRLHGIYDIYDEQIETPEKLNLPAVQQPKLSSLLIPSYDGASVLLQTNPVTPIKSAVLETPTRSGAVNKPHFEHGTRDPPSVHLHERLFTNASRGESSRKGFHKSAKHDGTPIRGIFRNPMTSMPLKDMNETSFEGTPDNQWHQDQLDIMSPEQNGFSELFQNSIAHYSHKVTANSIMMSGGNRGFPNGSARSSNKRTHSFKADEESWNATTRDDPMDIGLSGGESVLTIDKVNVNGVSRWRSDESSDEERELTLDRAARVDSSTKPPRRGIRSSRFAR